MGGSGVSAANGADGNQGFGGAIWMLGSAMSTNCTFIHNQAFGGDQGIVFINNPGLGHGGAIAAQDGEIILDHLTIAMNSAWRGEVSGGDLPHTHPADGGGLFVTNSPGMTNLTVVLSESILASNVDGSNVVGSPIDGGYNLSSDSTPVWSSPGSRNGVDPLLEALSDNGGPTLTMGLLAASPGRDVIPNGGTPFDQRGVSRPQGTASDIGAVEAEALKTAPLIIRDPEGGTVRVGENFTFTAVAGGSGPLYYEWTKDGAVLVNATNTMLMMTNLQTSDAGFYTLNVSNSFGHVSSLGARLQVDGTPLIESGPESVVASPGAPVDFSVEVNGPSLVFQWVHNGFAVAGANGSEFHIQGALGMDQGEYSVIVSNSFGAVTSKVATLSFDDSALKIVAQPRDETVEEGTSVTLQVLASGIPPISYQWFKDGTLIAGATAAELIISPAQFDDAGKYSLIVSNDYRVVTSREAILNVITGAANPELEISNVSTPGASVAITFNAESNRTYRLLRTTNLVDWTEVQRKAAASSGPLQFIQKIEADTAVFFKTATP